MAIEQQRAMVIGRVWQAVAQSGVDLSAVPRAEQEKLVGAIADGVLTAVNDLLGEAARQQPEEAAPGDEQILWQGRPFLSLFDLYTITNERIRIRTGVLGKDHEDIELVRLQDIDYSQTAGERLINIGDITLRSADSSNPVTVLRDVHDPEKVNEIIRRAWLDARRRYGFQFREQM